MPETERHESLLVDTFICKIQAQFHGVQNAIMCGTINHKGRVHFVVLGYKETGLGQQSLERIVYHV